MSDAIHNPHHYRARGGHETIELIRTYWPDSLRANVVKYICRAPFKGQREQDIGKALQYLTWAIQEQHCPQPIVLVHDFLAAGAYTPTEADVIRAVCGGDLRAAELAMRDLMT